MHIRGRTCGDTLAMPFTGVHISAALAAVQLLYAGPADLCDDAAEERGRWEELGACRVRVRVFAAVEGRGRRASRTKQRTGSDHRQTRQRETRETRRDERGDREQLRCSRTATPDV